MEASKNMIGIIIALFSLAMPMSALAKSTTVYVYCEVNSLNWEWLPSSRYVRGSWDTIELRHIKGAHGKARVFVISSAQYKPLKAECHDLLGEKSDAHPAKGIFSDWALFKYIYPDGSYGLSQGTY